MWNKIKLGVIFIIFEYEQIFRMYYNKSQCQSQDFNTYEAMVVYHATVGKYADTFCSIALTYTLHSACFANAIESNGIPITLACIMSIIV